MEQALGFAVIVVLYIVIGLMAAVGAIFIVPKILGFKAEQIFYAMFLIMIRRILSGVCELLWSGRCVAARSSRCLAFAAVALAGVRLPLILIIGYSLHGGWDLIHELQAHGVYSVFQPGQLTPVPLAYGFFCAAFDFSMAVYFYVQRDKWATARKAVPHTVD